MNESVTDFELLPPTLKKRIKFSVQPVIGGVSVRNPITRVPIQVVGNNGMLGLEEVIAQNEPTAELSLSTTYQREFKELLSTQLGMKRRSEELISGLRTDIQRIDHKISAMSRTFRRIQNQSAIALSKRRVEFSDQSSNGSPKNRSTSVEAHNQKKSSNN